MTLNRLHIYDHVVVKRKQLSMTSDHVYFDIPESLRAEGHAHFIYKAFDAFSNKVIYTMDNRNVSFLGNAILKKFKKLGYKKVITIDKKKLNLINQERVFKYLKNNKPDLVIIAAAKVGGILANDLYKSKFIYENLQIQNNLIHGSYLAKIKNL